jgi:hypothetical protein
MPDLGRETGKFIRTEEQTPKGVKTFEPAKAANSQADLAVLLPWRNGKTQPNLSVLLPWRKPGSRLVA